MTPEVDTSRIIFEGHSVIHHDLVFTDEDRVLAEHLTRHEIIVVDELKQGIRFSCLSGGLHSLTSKIMIAVVDGEQRCKIKRANSKFEAALQSSAGCGTLIRKHFGEATSALGKRAS